MLLDITRPVHPGMAIYPGNPAVVFTPISPASATTSALTHITLGSHTGTHIDAPAHIEGMGAGTNHYPLDQLCGPCQVVDATQAARVILAADLPATTLKRVVIKTANSNGERDTFDPDFIALADTAAAELIARHILLVGIDAPSIKKKGIQDNVHKLLLDAGIVILEGLWLRDIAPGTYELLCLPLAVGLDGAPVRAVLKSA